MIPLAVNLFAPGWLTDAWRMCAVLHPIALRARSDPQKGHFVQNSKGDFSMSMVKQQLLMGVLAASVAGGALASSHREAPFISTRPSVDGTDFYMFNSYEQGRAGYVTLIANYVPLQDPQGGPNYFNLDDNALYEISVDNTGSGTANLTFQFRFTTTTQGLTVPVGSKMVPVPLANIGALNSGATGVQNVAQTYTLTLVTGDRR